MKAGEILALWEIPLSDSLDGASEKEKHKGSALKRRGHKESTSTLQSQ